MAIYPKPDHTLYYVLTGKKQGALAYTFALSPCILFFIFFFSKN